ncbi:MAG: hypothetical protein EA411_12525 [Saprospirales bacterium]|nr:MAG: hypothetical protein EA411_12525 [Saprospirales bacterium]
MGSKNNSGIAIALAWPETYCRQAGGWYDAILNSVGISHHHYYKVGHAAVLLIDKSIGECTYFDFGRYHAPYGFGRVRSKLTDPGLKVETRASFSTDAKFLTNKTEILSEIQFNEECHGEGTIHAGECEINFQKAIKHALHMQENSPLPYGPFIPNGTNCSRFVNEVIRAGHPPLANHLKLKYLNWFTPTPMNNVQALNERKSHPHLRSGKRFEPRPIKDKSILKETIRKPKRPPIVPSHAQWLSGEGAGSWYQLDQLTEGLFELHRFDPTGKPEGRAILKSNNEENPNLNQAWQITHLSNCHRVTITQNDREFILLATRGNQSYASSTGECVLESKKTRDFD